MAVTYRKLNFASRDHERVSGQWFVLLWDIAHHDHVPFNVNEGHRTIERQRELVREKGLWSPQNPTGAAAATPNAPHIRTGKPNHAVDFDNAHGVAQAAKKRGVTLNFPLPTEPWHADPNAAQLAAYFKKNRVRVLREAAAKTVTTAAKTVVRIPTTSSDALVDFVASWEGEKLTAYQVPGESFYTIGVGHTGLVGGKPIHKGQVITKAQSRKFLRGDLAQAELAVEKLVPLRWRRNQRRYDTCVDLVFNMGAEILTAKPPLTTFGEVLKKPVNAKTIDEACAAIQLYNKGGNPLRVMDGLTRRRKAEAELFKNGKYIHN